MATLTLAGQTLLDGAVTSARGWDPETGHEILVGIHGDGNMALMRMTIEEATNLRARLDAALRSTARDIKLRAKFAAERERAGA